MTPRQMRELPHCPICNHGHLEERVSMTGHVIDRCINQRCGYRKINWDETDKEGYLK